MMMIMMMRRKQLFFADSPVKSRELQLLLMIDFFLYKRRRSGELEDETDHQTPTPRLCRFVFLALNKK